MAIQLDEVSPIITAEDLKESWADVAVGFFMTPSMRGTALGGALLAAYAVYHHFSEPSTPPEFSSISAPATYQTEVPPKP